MSEQEVATRNDIMSQVFGGNETRNLPAVVSGQGFNPDAFHAMQARDDQLIADNLLHGYNGKEFVYSFDIQGKKVTGISVVGARQLASYYGGIKARIVASVDKTGSLFVFKSFEPMDVRVQQIPQLGDETDFYEVVMEVTDLKTGSSIMVRKKETKKERKRDGTFYDRPHYDVIAESKAYRNGVLSILPQDVIAQFEARALVAGSVSNEKTIQQLRDGALAFAAKNGIAIDRAALEDLTFAQINGLGSAAKDLVQFKEALIATGLMNPVTRPVTRSDDQSNARTATQRQVTAAVEEKTEAKQKRAGREHIPESYENAQTGTGAPPAEEKKPEPIPTTAGATDVQTENPAAAEATKPAARRTNPLRFE